MFGRRSETRGFARHVARSRAMFLALATVIVCGSLIVARPVPTSAAPISASITAATSAPVKAAFYYPWFPETEHWSTHYSPALGHYDSSSAAVLASHVAMAQYAGLDAFISSWWGRGTPTDSRLPLLLNAARAKNFHIAPYYELESKPTPPTSAQLSADLTYLANLARDRAWLTASGKPVLFIYNTGSEASCAGIARVEAANAGRFYISAKVFAGYLACRIQPESWHQYGPASAYDQQGTYSATVSPGFFKFSESSPRLARDLTTFRKNLARQIASGAQWQLTTTFNEWGEGTALEPATQWVSASGDGSYLDAMRAAYVAQPAQSSSSAAVVRTDPTVTVPAAPRAASANGVGIVDASADAYVTGSSPSSNYGADPVLMANASGPITTHIKFEVSGSNGASSAVFQVFSKSSGAVKTRVYAEASDWTEAGISYTNAPARGVLLGVLSTLSANHYSTLTVPLHGDGVYSFVLTTGATASRYMTSRETPTPPQLVLSAVQSTSPATTTATTTTTPTTSTPASSSTSNPSSTTPTSTSISSTSGTVQLPPTGITKVLTFIEENHSLAQMESGMPYLYSQATAYGYADNYSATRHPSLPNYLAIAGGSTFGVTDDGNPSVHPIAGHSVFGQALAAGKTAKSYQESMPSNCYGVAANRYAPKHNPWAYFTDERSNCQLLDVPSGSVSAGALHDDIIAGSLPNLGEVTPNLDNDAHDGSLATADAWLKGWLSLIYASPDWRSGHLAIVVTADEDDSSSGNKVLTVVIHPSQSHHVVTTALTHYSLTGLFGQLTGAGCLAAGCSAPNFADAFGLPLTG